MHIVDVFGRVFISALFMVEAVRKFLNPDMSMIYMSDHGVPELLFYPSVFFELIFPLVFYNFLLTDKVEKYLMMISLNIMFEPVYSQNLF